MLGAVISSLNRRTLDMRWALEVGRRSGPGLLLPHGWFYTGFVEVDMLHTHEICHPQP